MGVRCEVVAEESRDQALVGTGWGGLSASPLPATSLLRGTSRHAKEEGGTLGLSLRPSRLHVGCDLAQSAIC